MTGSIIIANCSVEYNGRGKSSLVSGIYLIIVKPDGSIQIHSSRLLKPKNYMGPRTKVEILEDRIVATRSKETIEIVINNLIMRQDIKGWEDNYLQMEKTEEQLSEALFNELMIQYPCDIIVKEYPTKDVGVIDVLRTERHEDIWHIYEVKRKTASIANISQTLRYVDYAKSQGHSAVGYIVAPSITANAKKLAEINHINIIIRDFTMV